MSLMMAAQLYEYNKDHGIIHSKRTNCMIYKLHLKKAIKKRPNNRGDRMDTSPSHLIGCGET